MFVFWKKLDFILLCPFLRSGVGSLARDSTNAKPASRLAAAGEISLPHTFDNLELS
jgi:hypothetical protein